eukprot:scaffold9015_cov60-Phaeocystis_antarctica.AAC.3
MTPIFFSLGSKKAYMKSARLHAAAGIVRSGHGSDEANNLIICINPTCKSNSIKLVLGQFVLA